MVLELATKEQAVREVVEVISARLGLTTAGVDPAR